MGNTTGGQSWGGAYGNMIAPSNRGANVLNGYGSPQPGPGGIQGPNNPWAPGGQQGGGMTYYPGMGTMPTQRPSMDGSTYGNMMAPSNRGPNVIGGQPRNSMDGQTLAQMQAARQRMGMDAGMQPQITGGSGFDPLGRGAIPGQSGMQQQPAQQMNPRNAMGMLEQMNRQTGSQPQQPVQQPVQRSAAQALRTMQNSTQQQPVQQDPQLDLLNRVRQAQPAPPAQQTYGGTVQNSALMQGTFAPGSSAALAQRLMQGGYGGGNRGGYGAQPPQQPQTNQAVVSALLNMFSR